MDILNDFIYIQKKALRNTFKNPRYIVLCAVILAMGIIATNIISNILFGVLKLNGYISGLLVYIFKVCILGFIMSILYTGVKDTGSSIVFQDYDFKPFAIKIIQVGFVIYIAQIILSPIAMNFYFIVTIIAMIVLNALPETIYLEDYDGYNSIKASVEFLKDNALNWGLPNIIIMALIYASIDGVSLFTGLYFSDLKSVIKSVVVILIMGIYLMYRGMLFEILNGSSRRKREFMRNFNE